MDLLIEKDGQSRKLSELGLYNIAVDDSSPSVDISTRTVKGRNGRIFDGLTYNEKVIEVRARLSVPTMEAFFDKKDELTRYILGEDSFYITKMYPHSRQRAKPRESLRSQVFRTSRGGIATRWPETNGSIMNSLVSHPRD